ncbi:MAG: serine/threonine-protein kinase [Myxococcota bacterium]
MGDDRKLLQRFLDGELPEAEIAALEARLDAEPDLQRQLRSLAQRVFTDALPERGTTRVSLLARSAQLPPTPPVAHGLELREVIAEGGMGVVHRARQNSLGRTVAVKTVREGRHEAPLIQEAVLTGYLEHPNIVPVHDIALAEAGEPVVVMKHIEGQSWRRTLSSDVDPGDLGDDGTAGPRSLAWHLSVVMQVCQALRFAHSRGVIHRDVKPDNVMIGTFDEVYLLDWGLAVSLEDGSRLPSLKAQRGVAGTPAYMAPEQLADDAPRRVGIHTDVYQVGACLYHAAVGSPPQEGTTLDEIRDQIDEREELLVLPPQVPAELGAIIGRAMAVSPADRFESVDELRTALEAFLEHRSSNDLLEAGISAADAMVAADDADDAIAAERAFFDAAFKFRAALDSWPQNRIARRRLNRVVRRRVAQLIARDAPLAARRALALVDIDDPELHEQVERATTAQAEKRRRLRAYERGDDRTIGLGIRRALGLALGAVWVGMNTLVVALPVTSLAPLVAGALACLALSLVATRRTRRVMLDVRLNRYNASIVIIAQVVHCLMLVSAWAEGRSVTPVLVELLALWSLTAGAVAAVVDRRIGITAVAYAAAYVLCRSDPAWLRVALPGAATVMVAVSLGINYATASHATAHTREDDGVEEDPPSHGDA